MLNIVLFAKRAILCVRAQRDGGPAHGVGGRVKLTTPVQTDRPPEPYRTEPAYAFSPLVTTIADGACGGAIARCDCGLDGQPLLPKGNCCRSHSCARLPEWP